MRGKNKLEALATLANAWFYLVREYGQVEEVAMSVLGEKFHAVRRSMQSISDAVSTVDESNEGYNGRMPTQF